MGEREYDEQISVRSELQDQDEELIMVRSIDSKKNRQQDNYQN